MDTESFLAAASDLLAIPSTADRPAELVKALEFAIEFATAGSAAAGCVVERFESGGKPSALLYAGDASGERPAFRVIFNGHLDVVPAPASQFIPRSDGDRIYARGAQDMKVSALALALVFRELAGELPYPLGLQLVTDEEIGGRDGTLHQLNSGVTADFVIVGEHSRLRIVAESKGMVAASLRAVGKAAHSAYPWLGDNALVKLQASVARILERYPVATQEAWRTTVNLARIETSNQARNKIPDMAEAWLDIRYPPQDPDFDRRSVAEVVSYLTSFCEAGVIPLVDHVDPPHHANTGSLEIGELQRAVTDQGYDASFLRKHGAADGRFYYQRGIDAVIFGVGGDGQHGPDEYVDTATIEPYCRALRQFLGAIGTK